MSHRSDRRQRQRLNLQPFSDPPEGARDDRQRTDDQRADDCHHAGDEQSDAGEFLDRHGVAHHRDASSRQHYADEKQ